MTPPGDSPVVDPAAAQGGRDAELWRQLLLLIESGEVVPIVGRDLLAVGPPENRVQLYSWLAERVARGLGVPAETDPTARDHLNGVACRYLAQGGDSRQIYMNVFEEARGLPALGMPEALLKLAAIDESAGPGAGFKLFITTTFDNSLQTAIDNVRFKGLPRTEVRAYSPTNTRDLPKPIADLEQPVVFHLLGRVAPTPDYVVTEEDALEFVHSLHTKRPTMLFDEIYKKDLLVIGCRFPGWLIRSFIRLARTERLLEARGRTVFVVDTGAREDRALIDFLKAFRTRTEVFEHTGPIEFVDELYARWHRPGRIVAQPADAAPVSRLAPGSIFISYASEDREVARAVARALTEAQLDVWFDRDQLMVGDAFEDQIQDNIQRSGLFLPILSRRSAVRDERFFRLEWHYAFRRAAMLPPSVNFMFPVVIDDLPYGDAAIDLRMRNLDWFSLRDGLSPVFVEAVKKHFREHQVEG